MKSVLSACGGGGGGVKCHKKKTESKKVANGKTGGGNRQHSSYPTRISSSGGVGLGREGGFDLNNFICKGILSCELRMRGTHKKKASLWLLFKLIISVIIILTPVVASLEEEKIMPACTSNCYSNIMPACTSNCYNNIMPACTSNCYNIMPACTSNCNYMPACTSNCGTGKSVPAKEDLNINEIVADTRIEEYHEATADGYGTLLIEFVKDKLYQGFDKTVDNNIVQVLYEMKMFDISYLNVSETELTPSVDQMLPDDTCPKDPTTDYFFLK